jgi:signal transduction histidine kinase
MNTRTSAIAGRILQQRRWLLLGLLGLLHLMLLEGIDSIVGRALLVGHIGLFILWQPFVRAERRLSAGQLAAVALGIAAATLWAGNWTLILWTMALAGILGGKVFFHDSRGAKLFYLLALAYLVCVLLVVLVPQGLPAHLDPLPQAFRLAQYGLPALFVAMAFLPVEQTAEDEAEVIDFVYSAFIFLLLAALVLGSIAAMLVLGRGYLESLAATVVAFAAMLLLLAWAWNPHLGFTGFGLLFSRYMLSLGLPLERWLHELADNLQREEQPEAFLTRSLEGMIRLPWVNGCEWRSPEGAGSSGRQEGRRSAFRHGPLTLTLFTGQPLSPALNWHFNLLTQLLGEFYEAKRRAQELQQLSYVKAIHQTGARLTHDVKNLLQSLNTLCLAAADDEQLATPAYQALLKRQLPVIARRLQQTLEKLQRPETEGAQFVSAGRWWAGLQTRYGGEGILFSSTGARDEVSIPAPLFDSAAENLLQNALAKRQCKPELRIRVEFAAKEGASLRVCDDGEAIAAEVARQLFRAPVPSRSGLGIGLYQVARHARLYGYELTLADNVPGRVCFLLERKPETEAGD